MRTLINFAAVHWLRNTSNIGHIPSVLAICTLWLARSAHGLRTSSDEALVLDLRLTQNGNLYYAHAEVGLGLKLKLLVNTVDDNIWFAADDTELLSREKAGRTHGAYPLGIQPKTKDVQFFETPVKVGHESLGSHLVTVVTSEVADARYKLLGFGVDGLLGVESNKYYSSRAAGSLVRRLFEKRQVSKEVVSLFLNSSATSADEVAGALVIGGTDERFYEGEIDYFRFESDGRAGWYCSLYSLELDWSRVAAGRQSRARLPVNERQILPFQFGSLRMDSSSHLFAGPVMIMDKFHVDHMKARQRNLYVVEQPVTYYVFDDCALDNKPDFVFQLGGKELRVGPEDYVVQLQDGPNTICISAFAGVWTRSFILGTHLLKKHYVVFDYENKRLGLARPSRV